MSIDLKKVYDGSFASRQRFDDGGYASYVSAGPDANYATFNPSTGGADFTPAGQGSGAPSAGDISALTQGATSGGNSLDANALTGSGVGNGPSSLPSSGGALSQALSALGSKQGASVLSAITAILGAAGHMQTSKAYATLPTMPGLGAMPSLPGTSGSTGYGPPGGYNWQNYRGLTSSTPGTGYAPRTQAPPAQMSSYYTYGQGPEQQFFQQVNPQGGPIAPVTHKKGGRIKKYAVGGMAAHNAVGGMMHPMAQNTAMRRPPQPMMGIAPISGGAGAMPRPMGMPGQRPGMRPFAEGGQNVGALSTPEQGSRYVRGPGDGTSDDIPARLANGEYVLSADVVSGLGNGDNNSGAKVLDGFVHNLRAHKAQNAAKGKLPADAKPIHHYMKGGK